MITKIILGTLAVLAVLILGFVIVVAMQPSEFRIARSAKMKAPPAAVFAEVNDFHKWDAWSPWAKLDPNIKTSYEGAPAGPGAMYSWTGNSQVGEGRMTITDSKPAELIKIKLEFVKPFAATNATNFMFTSQGNQTSVKWTMDGDNNFMGKAFGLFMNMDKLVGGDFEKGLAQMKAVSETAAK